MDLKNIVNNGKNAMELKQTSLQQLKQGNSFFKVINEVKGDLKQI